MVRGRARRIAGCVDTGFDSGAGACASPSCSSRKPRTERPTQMSDRATRFTAFVDQLNHGYECLHTAKEDAFWVAYMDIGADRESARAALNEHESALKRFLADPARLATVRQRRMEADAAVGSADGPSEAERVALAGWERTFAAHVIDSAEARALSEEIIEDESRLHAARAAFKTHYDDPDGGPVEASSVKLGMLISNHRDERVRRSAWEGMRSVEPHVLEHGFLELVRKRNRLGRLLGGEDYYDATVRRVEGMSKADIFDRLDELERRTRERARASLAELVAARGSDAQQPWNVRFFTAGDVSAEQDPYFPFRQAIARWGRSFAALGIGYQGAHMVLDLVDRKGKYENGFMHGPVPAWVDRGVHRPARIHFTANAIPGVIGSGRRATETLFHEGGHAAHFANADMPAPCFSQEFAPTSVGFSETQSMFLDSLLSDADWQARYARSVAGEAMPLALIEKGIACDQPFAAWRTRAMLAVCYGERAIYEIPDAELTAERVLHELREVERRLLFLPLGSPRPVLSVPHLLSGESSAYYHGYVLAEMAVRQTRGFFESRDGHLVDNPRIGPDLRESYWREGNRRTFLDYVEGLTGTPLSASALAEENNRTAAQEIAIAHRAVERLADVPAYAGEVRLGASIRVMHGRDEIAADDGGDFDGMAQRFAAWIGGLESA